MNKVKEVNFLGLILGETLSWKPHISQVANKVSKSVGVIHKSSFCLTRTALCTLCTILFTYLFLSSILHVRVGSDISYPP